MLSMDLDLYTCHLWWGDEQALSLTLPTWLVLLSVVGVILYRKTKRKKAY